MSSTIFIVEDDQTIISVLEKQLQQWGYQVLLPADFQQIALECQHAAPDLVLMDISLPYYNGFHWTKAIRDFSEVPIIFLSSADDQMNQVMAMSMGADDFIAKPFDLTILLAKIQALLRRSYQYGHQATNFSLGDRRFLPAENLIEGTPNVLLTPNESRILLLLLEQRGKIVARETIIEALWQSDEFIDNNTLAVNMTRLRKKLASSGIDDLIQTVKNKGYLIEEEQL
ncbi:response regulator transcription factor [Enterococcus sp. CSURQ0835]|uniref:response regulator transcription factor n=1 Tax=Enterococcus sp. CSURQ0835 TaxID=2681394 RepID=UPI001358BEE6|nr:response regulator transcription factor [Enterococcus sp. CSURQ0835]